MSDGTIGERSFANGGSEKLLRWGSLASPRTALDAIRLRCTLWLPRLEILAGLWLTLGRAFGFSRDRLELFVRFVFRDSVVSQGNDAITDLSHEHASAWLITEKTDTVDQPFCRIIFCLRSRLSTMVSSSSPSLSLGALDIASGV